VQKGDRHEKETGMKRSNSKRTAEVQFADEHLTIGMDVGDAFTNYCVLNRNGEVVVEGRFATTRTGVSKFAAGLPATTPSICADPATG